MSSVESVIEYINNYGSTSRGNRAKCINALYDIFWYVSDVRVLYEMAHGQAIVTSAAERGLLDLSTVYCSDALSGYRYPEGVAEYVDLLNRLRYKVAHGTLDAPMLVEEAYKMEYTLVTHARVYVSPLFCLSVRYVVGLDSSVPKPGYFNECYANQ